MSIELPDLDELDEIAKNAFTRKVVRKIYARTISVLKEYPTYVAEYIISEYLDKNGFLDEYAIEEINANTLTKFDRVDKETLKSTLIQVGSIELTDHYQVFTDLHKGVYYCYIKTLDEKTTVDKYLLSPNKFQRLLKGGLWGIAKIDYIKGGEYTRLNISSFKPLQVVNAIKTEYIRAREQFTTKQWINFLIRTMGLNPQGLDRKTKLMYIARLIPFVEPASNMLELGPPGTGKSYVFENMSQYSRVLVGGEITPSKLIYNQNTHRNGIIFYKDVICFDEIDQVNKGVKELMPKLQQIMASNRVERGQMEATTTVSLVFQGNPEFTMEYLPNYTSKKSYISALPSYMKTTHFLDRIHIFIYGWKFKRYSDDLLNKHLGLINNYFAEILHQFRKDYVSPLINQNVEFFIKDKNGNIRGISLRDKIALETTLSGFIKLLFPHQKISTDDWQEIIELSIELRTNIIKEMTLLDETLERTIDYKLINQNKPLVIKEMTEINKIKPMVAENETNINNEIDTVTAAEQSPESESPPSQYYLKLLEIEVNNQNIITNRIPYFLLKILKSKNAITIKNNNFSIQNEQIPHGINLINIETNQTNYKNKNIPRIITSNINRFINYRQEEELAYQIYNGLVELKDLIKFYFSKLNEISFIKNELKIIDSDKNKNLIEEFNKITSIINEVQDINGNELINEINLILEYFEESNSLNIDLLNIDYHPIILNSKKIIALINKKIKLWKEKSKPFKEFNNIIEKMHKIVISKTKGTSSIPLLFSGEKFSFFVIDVNNIYYSFKNKFKNINTSGDNSFDPFQRLYDNFFKSENIFYAHFFATKEIEHIKELSKDIFKSVPNKIKIDWYIEKRFKNFSERRYIDVDAAIQVEATSFIEKYMDQIDKFYIVSADRDFYRIIELTKRYKIPTFVIALSNDFINKTYARLVGDSNVYFLY